MHHFIRDVVIVILTILLATYFYESGALESFLRATEDLGIIRIFVAGLFFTSIFTTAFSISIFIALGSTHDPVFVALIGGFGALLGDYIIFRFLKESISDDVEFVLSHTGFNRVKHALRMKSMRWLLTAIGALIIASPFPNEIGLAMLGVSGMSHKVFLPISYVLNVFGIFILVSVGALIS